MSALTRSPDPGIPDLPGWALAPPDPAEAEQLRKRILTHVLKMPRSAGACWLWRGQRDGAGYGTIRIGGRKRLAHRVAFEAWRGPDPWRQAAAPQVQPARLRAAMASAANDSGRPQPPACRQAQTRRFNDDARSRGGWTPVTTTPGVDPSGLVARA